MWLRVHSNARFLSLFLSFPLSSFVIVGWLLERGGAPLAVAAPSLDQDEIFTGDLKVN